MSQSQSTKLQWINCVAARVPMDQDIQTLIRRRAAMHTSLLRKCIATRHRTNSRQFPVFEPTVSAHDAASLIYRGDSIPAPIPPSDYERMALKYGLHAFDLSVLTSIKINSQTGDVSLELTDGICPLLRKMQNSFFSYLPQRYGHSDCLDASIECALARVRQILTPKSDNWDGIVMKLYIKALRDLRTALQCPKQRLASETLCATELLGIYEVPLLPLPYKS
jgi:hypothetical protein